jgi:hypothetical protein
MKTKIRIFRKNLRLHIILVLIIFLIPRTFGQLSGTYTINPSGGGIPNFKSFSEAVDALKSQGVSGAVLINIFPGTYEVHTIIPQITGSSSTNTITFQSSTGDSTQVTFSYTFTSTSTENYIIKLDGADYITFKSITFNASDGDAYYGTVFSITGGANNNKFLNNVFYGKSGYNPYGSLISSSGTRDQNNVFENNLFSFGLNAIALVGVNNTTLSAGTIIRNNVFKQQTNSSIWLQYQDAPLIKGNKIENPDANDYGIYLDQVDRGYQVLVNEIIMTRPYGAIYINNCDGLIGSNGLIANNMIMIIAEDYETDYCTGIHLYNSSYLQVYHNSVLITSGTNTRSNSLYQYGGANIDIRNNILANFTQGYAYNVTDAVNISDYNNYYTTGNYLAKWKSINKEDLEALISANAMDGHSVSANPVFNSDNDLHTTTFRLQNKGTNLTSIVSVDFDGEARSISPDIGADEFITSTGSALSGEYFIGGPSPDFTKISDAVLEMNKYGISSSVIFNIRDDNSPYPEQIDILPITGSNASNTVTFQPDPSNTEDVIISFNAESNDANYTLKLQRGSYITVRDLILMSENSNYGNVIDMNGRCQYNTISGCTIACPNQGYYTNGLYSDASVLKNLFIIHNKFNSGNSGIYLTGSSQELRQDIEISENDFYENYYGIQISYGSNNMKILKNRINSTIQGIELSNFTGSIVYKGLIANNFINITENQYNTIALNLNYVSYLQVYFNTVKISEQSTYDNTRVLSIGTNSNTDIRNNIFCNLGPGYAYYKSSSGSIDQSDYNVLFTAGNYVAYYDGNQPKLSDLQAISSKDSHSLDSYPVFISDENLHINSPLLDGAGTAISGLTSDIDGETRNNPPDIGADEYTSSITPISEGTYKIGGAAPDYNNIKQAFVDLQSRGISGPVVFEIRNGEYNEFIGSVFEIPGCTKSDSIIVRSESGNPEDVIIYYNLNTQDNKAIFDFKAVNYFTLKGLTISTSGEYNRSQIEISGSSANINIINNELITTANYYSVISIKGLIDQLLIQDNLISGGRGILFDNYTETSNTRIISNIISGDEGIIFNTSSKGTDTWIIGNKITETDEIAIQLSSQIKPRVIGNIILASSGQGINIYNCVNNIPFYGLIANNMINLRGYYYSYGIYLEYTNKRIYIYNNTINLALTSEYYDSYGIYVNDYTSNQAELKLLNNIITNSSGFSRDWVLYINDASDIIESDHNNYFTTGTSFVNWGGTTCSDLTALRSANGMDAHSLSLDPLFYSELDLHSAQAAFHQAGIPLADVPYDIDSVPRDPAKPDIGAVEFTCGPPVFDILVSPTCLGDTTTFIDRSTNITPGATYGWDFDGDYVPDDEYISTKSNDTIKYYFNAPGQYDVHFIVSQIGGCNDYTTINVTVKNSPELVITTQGEYCGENNGAATVHVTGGDGPFKYFWSTGANDSTITDLAQGTYTVAVTDASGCISDAETTIGNRIEVGVTQLEPSTCGIPDGGAEVSATGGAKPYSYVWSDGNNTVQNWNLSPGRYYVNVIDANNCYSQGYVDIENDGSGPQVTLKKTVNNKCYGERLGSIDIAISGGVQPYTLKWSNGKTTEDIDNLAAGIYDVLVTAEDGCLGAGSFEVIQPTQLQISSVVENSTCAGADGRAMAVVSGGTKPYVYQWQPSGGIYQIEEGLSAGIYTVTVFDGYACKAVLPVIVNSIGGPVVTINSITGTGCTNTTNGAIDISVSGGTPLYTFEWSNGQTTPDISNLSPGTYEIRVTDQAGCIGLNTALVKQTPPAVNPICLVTVDTVTGKNMVVWEKQNTTDVDYYIIYRENDKSNVYDSVGIRPVDSLSIFIDPIADPMVRSRRYKLSVVDICGNESALSDHHKTMHLTMNLGLNGAVNLIWDHYEGFDVSTYEVYRYNSQTGWQNIEDMPANLTSYADLTPNMDDLIYYIQTEKSIGCIATDYKAETLNTSRSNRQNNLKITGSPVNYFGNLNLVIWPNPSSGIYNLSMDNINSRNIILKVFDISGKLVFINEYKNPGNKFETILDFSSFTAGIYHVYLKTENTIFHRALIKE